MKNPASRPLILPFVLLTLLSNPRLPAAEKPLADYKPELFKSAKLIYQDSFDGPLNTDFWEIRQHSTWEVKDGILTGSPSTKEFQDQMIAKGDKAHAGFKPVIWLKQVPENLICTLRLRYNGDAYHPRYPLVDVGHHIHTLLFGDKKTTLTLKKDVEKQEVTAPHLPLNQWVDIAIELKKGSLLLKIDGKKHLFQSPSIDMTSQHQIDFKGLDLGTCQIDDIRLWEGL
ncbi:hypothetical protein EI77_02944 [Prosthecobacter fusiformis]|uniref:3-keto-disaccharide hydrolase domain-containing protein n=1 Tax=Prosthecobacter fusiformis TaxID=48464 RepID=A0A4R7RU83_9BACT|nr:hypothetical protein [Prosthecobacter fusiformis]TDU69292.1 hypothetical protein EI77_02944 [Prosthecobacter fusiformis]